MVLRVAPSAFRTPISRVRSVTLTSMMFMMPMPPTSRLTPAIPASSIEKVWVVSLKVSRMSDDCWMLKSASSVGRMRCSRRMTRSISPHAGSSSSGEGAAT